MHVASRGSACLQAGWPPLLLTASGWAEAVDAAALFGGRERDATNNMDACAIGHLGLAAVHCAAHICIGSHHHRRLTRLRRLTHSQPTTAAALRDLRSRARI